MAGIITNGCNGEVMEVGSTPPNVEVEYRGSLFDPASPKPTTKSGLSGAPPIPTHTTHGGRVTHA